MARPRKIRAAALNIVTHPHSEEGYSMLLKAAVKNRIVARYWGNKAGMFGSMKIHRPPGRQVENVFSGEIHLFTDFDPNSSWFNITERTVASEDEVKTISLPKNWRPDHKAVPYVFFAKHHCLVYDTDDLAPSSARKLVELILRAPEVAKERTVAVTVEPAKDSVTALLRKPRLKLVSLTLRRPNPDHLASLEARIQERFKNTNTATKKEEFKAVAGKSLKPDEELEQVAAIAGSNGEVVVKHVDTDGNTREESTREHPKRLFGTLDTDESTVIDAIYQLGFEHLEKR